MGFVCVCVRWVLCVCMDTVCVREKKRERGKMGVLCVYGCRVYICVCMYAVYLCVMSGRIGILCVCLDAVCVPVFLNGRIGLVCVLE